MASPRKPRVLLITGVPGVGKTTVILRVAESLEGQRLGGFYTEEIRTRGERKGFRLRTFAGEERVIAHVDFPKRHRVGKYGVDVSALDEMAGRTLARDPGISIYLVDEIGKMECLSEEFIAAMRALLASGTAVVATVALKGGGFIDEAKRTGQPVLWHVKKENRDAMPSAIVAWLARRAEETAEEHRPDQPG